MMRTRLMTLRAAGALAAALLAVTVGSALASGAPAPVWGTPIPADSHTPTAVTCVSVAACVGVDASGQAFSSTTPASGGWTTADTGVGGTPLNSVSCVPGGACVAVGNLGKVTVLSAIGGSWTPHAGSIDGATTLNDVACPTATLCIAVDNASRALTSLDGGTTWSPATSLGSSGPLNAISCPSATFCAAVDNSGHVLSSSTPTTFPWTSSTQLTGAPLTSISCASASACVATANDGTVFATGNASAASPTWSSTPLDPTGGPQLTVSCSASGLCAIVDHKGLALTSDNPAAGPPTWTPAPSFGSTTALNGVSCIAAGLCLAVDANGAAIAGLLPAPAVTTGTATASSQTDATLTATVDPGDAALESCQFNYGATTAYGASVPCSAVPAAGGGAQAVSAQIAGLVAGTTYHFQIAAASGVASATGADGTFTTPPPLKASPSLSGTPALGSTLTCKPNVTIPAGLTVTFGWLRDTVAIPGAVASTYLIAAADVSHHLSCSVTIAGDGGSTTATSGFSSVPAQSGATITESFVGTAKDSANTVRAPVTCSPQAAGKCTFTLTLTVTQSGKKTIVGKSTSSVAVGATATLSVRLNATGKALLAKKRRLAVTLTVKGTVLGTLVATLKTDHLTLKATTRRHATHHRG